MYNLTIVEGEGIVTDKMSLERCAKLLGIEVNKKPDMGGDGFVVNLCRNDRPSIEITRAGVNIIIRCSEPVQFFRALGLMKEGLIQGGDFHITEEVWFGTCGIMFDMSQSNAVLNVDTVKRFLDRMALMGLNMIMLYMEDSYTIKEQPYFGYMRGRYGYQEMKEIDDYAYKLGIEVIPAIQTLGHLNDIIRWTAFEDIAENTHTLLVGEDRTYSFIKQMIEAVSAPFRSRRIHIGMDEAWGIGRGRYLDRFGLRNTSDIIGQHLKKVLEITEDMGLRPMIWSDMFYKDPVSGVPYGENICITEEQRQAFPKGVDQVFWDYLQEDEDYYNRVINQHKEMSNTTVFAGGVLNWISYGVNYGKTISATNAALKTCKHEGVREVFATVWGTNGCENNFSSTLLGIQLFAEHCYSSEVDAVQLKMRFETCTGAEYEAFMDIRLIDETPGISEGNHEHLNPSRYLLWQNILTGIFDKNIEGLSFLEHYNKLGARMEGHADANPIYKPLFTLLAKLCRVLELKASLGIEITSAYQAGDRDKLGSLCYTLLPVLRERCVELMDFHRELWYKENKPFGWDILDLRYAGLVAGIDTAAKRLKDFLYCKVEKLEELEEQRLSFYHDVPSGLVFCNEHIKTFSSSHFSLYHGFAWREI